ncbi:MAG: glycosyltransferase, partial [Anaerolineae bacterium]
LQEQLSNVRFLPFQPRSVLPDLYATSDVCLVPLKHGLASSSVPSKVYTVMSAARPLIAAVDEGSDVWQFVESTDCGLVVPPEDSAALADAILTLYHHRSRGREMGLRARDEVERGYTPQIIAEKYLNLLQRLCHT